MATGGTSSSDDDAHDGAPNDAHDDAPADAPADAGDAPLEDARTPATTEAARRRGIGFVVIALIAAVAAILILPKIPRAQTLRLHLGAGSSRIAHATFRLSRAGDDTGGREGAWERVVTYRWERGAPPSVAWTFDLPNGPAALEVELETAADRTVGTIPIELEGQEMRVELEGVMRGLE